MEKSNPFSYLGLCHNVKSGLKWAGWIALVLLTYFEGNYRDCWLMEYRK